MQDFYATELTESQGNTDTSTNGSDEYVNKVTMLSRANETPFKFLNNNSSSNTAGFSTAAGGDFPNASSVVIGVWMDEATSIGIPEVGSDYDGLKTSTIPVSSFGMTNLANLRAQIQTMNAINPDFYRGIVYPVELSWTEGETGLQSAWDDAVTNASGTQFKANGLAAVQNNLTRPGGDLWIGGNTTNGYYTEIVINSLIELGYNIAPYAG